MKESAPTQKKDENRAENKDVSKVEKQKLAEKKRLLTTETFRLLEHFYDDSEDIKIREDFKKALLADNTYKQTKLQSKFKKEHEGYQMEMDVQRLKDEISGFEKGIEKRDEKLLEKLQEVKDAHLNFFDLGKLRWTNIDEEILKVKTRFREYIARLNERMRVAQRFLKPREEGWSRQDLDTGSIRGQEAQKRREVEELSTEIARVELLIKE